MFEVGDLASAMGNSVVFQITKINHEVEGTIIGLADGLINSGWEIGHKFICPAQLCNPYTE